MLRFVVAPISACVVALAAGVFGGPASSGALFLLRAGPQANSPQSLPEDHTPLHKGGVDLGTGLYIRENEDLVVAGVPTLILRRTYLSGYRASKQFGVGTTHTGEEYLIGDGERFQWVSLILARGSRINFRRVSAGTTFLNAMYVHDETPTEWQGAQLGWAGLGWVLRKRDGSVALYRGCGPGSICSIVQSRGPDGKVVHYRRDSAGRLREMDDGSDRWIAFEYDEQNRIVRAHDSNGREVRYEYDGKGRLTRATASTGVVHRYTHTDLDELATIDEPGTSIQNEFENGRVVRQVNRYPDGDPLVFRFRYDLEAGRVVRTDTSRSDGTFSRYTWGTGGHATTESRGREGYQPIAFTYDRHPTTKVITAVSVDCPDFGAGARRLSSPVAPVSAEGPTRPDAADEVKADLVSQCFLNR